MPRAARRIAVLPLLALVLAACAARGAPREPQPETYVRVANQNFLDMNVYVLRSSQRVRLGTVTGNSVARFRIPGNVIFGPTPLRFLADPIGGRGVSSSFEITVAPGDEVTLTIPPS